MTRYRINRILAAGGASLIALCALPGTANAQFFSPCMLIGSPMPPPCIKTDYKKLIQAQLQQVHELEKIAQTVNTIKEAKAATEGVVSEARDVASTKIDISLPNVSLDAGPILQGVKGDIAGYANKMGQTFYAGSDATVIQTQQTQRNRQLVEVDAVVDAYAYGLQGRSETESANTRYAELGKRACKSKDLRTDWTVNSAIKLELMNARARQSHLYSSYLKFAAATAAKNVSTQAPQGFTPGTVISRALAPVTEISKGAQVGQLTDLLSKSRSLLGSLSVITMAASATQSVNDDQRALDTFIQNMTQKQYDMQRYANSWAKNSDHCSGSYISNAIMSGNADSLTNNGKKSCIKLSDASDMREFMSFAYGISGENNAYPREDPKHWVYDGNGLNSFNMEKEFREKGLAEARAELAALEAQIPIENAKQGKTIDAAIVTADLEAIIAQANALGQDIGNGEDPGAKQQAAEILRQMQELMSQGTALPAVDTGIDPSVYDNAGVPPGGDVTPDPDQTPSDPVDPRMPDLR
jgi:hypothetical protein